MTTTKTTTTPKCMNMAEIRKKAKALGINPEKMKKDELIHAVQIAEGCTPCFGRSGTRCVSLGCCFTQDCLKISLAERRQADEHLKQEVPEHEQTEDELKQYRDRLEQYLTEQGDELTAKHKRLKCEGAKRKQAEKDLVKLQAKLDNADFIIHKQVELGKAESKAPRPSPFVVRYVAKVCGRILGLLARVFSR